MKRMSFVVIAAATASVVLGFGPGSALAQNVRSFVSGQGSDSNTCTLDAPCRTFQQALNVTNAGGEIIALDGAGYGTLTITRAVTITGTGVAASITASNTGPTAIAIDAGLRDIVRLRGLSLFSDATNGNAIDINSAKTVRITDCTISGFPGSGISVVPTASLTLDLRRVSADDNGAQGLSIVPGGSGDVAVFVDDSHFGGNIGGGVFIDGTHSKGTIRATLSLAAEGNGHAGVGVASTADQALPLVLVAGSKIVNNTNGVIGDGNVRVFIDRSQIAGNTDIAWTALNGAEVDTYQNNDVNANGSHNFTGEVTQIITK